MRGDVDDVNLRVAAQFTLGYDDVVRAVTGRDAEIQIRVRNCLRHILRPRAVINVG
jgi:hypothetical protein